MVVLVLRGAGDEPELFVFEFDDGGFDHAVVPTGTLVDAAGLVMGGLNFVRARPGLTLVVGEPGPASAAVAGDDEVFVVVDPKGSTEDAADLEAVSVGILEDVPGAVDAARGGVDSIGGIFTAVERFEADEFAGDRVLGDGGGFLAEAGGVGVARGKVDELPGFAIVEGVEELFSILAGVVADFLFVHTDEATSGVGGRGGDDAGRLDSHGRSHDGDEGENVSEQLDAGE